MFFKNAIVYRFTQPFRIHPLELHEKLAQHQSRAPGALEAVTYGFVSPTATDDLVVYGSLDTLFVATKRIEKILPSSAVKELLVKRIATVELEQNRKLSKKECQQLKCAIIDEQLPSALTKSTILNAFLDFRKQWIVVDVASTKKAEDFLSFLRKALGSLPVVPLRVSVRYVAPHVMMTEWVEHPSDGFAFNVEPEATLEGPESEKITLKGQDLFTREVTGHLSMGKQVTKIALTHNDALTFVLTDGLQLKRIKPLDTYAERLQNYYEASEPETYQEAILCDTLILSSAINNLLTDLGDELGAYEEYDEDEVEV